MTEAVNFLSDITNLMAKGIHRSFKNENINPQRPYKQLCNCQSVRFKQNSYAKI